jgi:coenzyme PQQ precursor peptide PqqA
MYPSTGNACNQYEEDTLMKVWTKPAVREQEVGLEVTSYLPAEIDVI